MRSLRILIGGNTALLRLLTLRENFLIGIFVELANRQPRIGHLIGNTTILYYPEIGVRVAGIIFRIVVPLFKQQLAQIKL